MNEMVPRARERVRRIHVGAQRKEKPAKSFSTRRKITAQECVAVSHSLDKGQCPELILNDPGQTSGVALAPLTRGTVEVPLALPVFGFSEVLCAPGFGQWTHENFSPAIVCSILGSCHSPGI